MIKKLTNHILSYLISSNAIDDNEETKDYYRYGIEITISSLINILLIIIIGIVSGNALESIVFLACFIPLRQFTGGFHANRSYTIVHSYFNIISCNYCNVSRVGKKAKNKTAHAIKSIAERMANMACGSASAWGMYQPKEPKKLDKSKK